MPLEAPLTAYMKAHRRGLKTDGAGINQLRLFNGLVEA
jgi:hypothetical protein